MCWGRGGAGGAGDDALCAPYADNAGGDALCATLYAGDCEGWALFVGGAGGVVGTGGHGLVPGGENRGASQSVSKSKSAIVWHN